MSVARFGPAPGADTDSLDPITGEIIRHGIDAAADQMLVTLRRTAFTQVIYESLDCSGAAGHV